MLRLTHFATVIGILCILFLLTRPITKTPIRIIKEREPVYIQRDVPVPVKIPVRIKYEQERDPLLYVDDGMYYRNPETIEGNRLWVEQRPKTNDLEWGYPLYTDRWSGGVYNGSYKTYSS
jgi:hypothetical protein